MTSAVTTANDDAKSVVAILREWAAERGMMVQSFVLAPRAPPSSPRGMAIFGRLADGSPAQHAALVWSDAPQEIIDRALAEHGRAQGWEG